MADAANVFLNSLWPDQKAKVSYAFDDAERLSWRFVPTGANYKPGEHDLRRHTRWRDAARGAALICSAARNLGRTTARS
jgi:hypothetical protein